MTDKILYPSIDLSISEKRYRTEDAINYSTVKKALHEYKTTAHYFAHELDPGKPEKKEKKDDSLVKGHATHVLIAQKDKFDSLYVQAPVSDKRTKPYLDTVKENPLKTVLTPKEWDDVHQMASSVLSHPASSILLSEGQAEVPMFWVDPITGERCKALIDWLRPDHHLVDFKTTFDASLRYRGFDSIVRYKLKYSWQLAHYTNGYKEITGHEPAWTFIAVENVLPFLTHAISYSSKRIEEFKKEWRVALNQYIFAKNNNWPGYSPYIEEVS